MSAVLPVVPRVLKTRDPKLPHLAFEWHEHTGKVYVVLVAGRWDGGAFVPGLADAKAQAWCIAEHCEDHGRFIGFVQTYLRGYKMGLADAKARAS